MNDDFSTAEDTARAGEAMNTVVAAMARNCSTMKLDQGRWECNARMARVSPLLWTSIGREGGGSHEGENAAL